jgi:hypothetical protein
MSEQQPASEKPNPLPQILNLLAGNKDEEKFAGLYLVTKAIDSTDAAALRQVHQVREAS